MELDDLRELGNVTDERFSLKPNAYGPISSSVSGNMIDVALHC